MAATSAIFFVKGSLQFLMLQDAHTRFFI